VPADFVYNPDMNRYLAAAMIAGLLSASALAYGSQIRADFYERLRESFRQSKADGAPELANVDIDTMQMSDFGIELSRKEIRKIQFAELIQGGWFVWMPLLLVLCLGAAYLWPHRPKSPPLIQPNSVTSPERL
jgi:hypothetical protein